MRASLLLLLVVACAEADGEPMRPAGSPEGPLILELFTSQGCSSCPPADRLLGKLATAGELGGRRLVPLSFHVDYWDDLGWSDPYALPAWTARQHAYARALAETRVYTPQLVIGGAAGLVGSHTVAVTRAIAAAPRPALLPVTARWTADHLELTTSAPAGADVHVAIWQDVRTARVTRGENAGEQLTNHRIVRRLERVAAAGRPGTLRVDLDRSWGEVGAVVFAQRPDRRIIASAVVARR